MALTKVTSGGLTDDSIVNADINSSAAVALSKLATDPSNASNLASGTVPTARLGSGTASSSTVLYGDQTYKAEPGGGITMADAWRTTGSQSCATGQTVISDDNGANWSRVNSDGYGTIGSAMTEDGTAGVFAFPETGIYWINASLQLQKNGDSRYNDLRIYTTGDDFSSEMWATMGRMFITQSDSNTTVGEMHTDFIYDVADVANNKIRFDVYVASGACVIGSDASVTMSGFTVVRLGDT